MKSRAKIILAFLLVILKITVPYPAAGQITAAFAMLTELITPAGLGKAAASVAFVEGDRAAAYADPADPAEPAEPAEPVEPAGPPKATAHERILEAAIPKEYFEEVMLEDFLEELTLAELLDEAIPEGLLEELTLAELREEVTQAELREEETRRAPAAETAPREPASVAAPNASVVGNAAKEPVEPATQKEDAAVTAPEASVKAVALVEPVAVSAPVEGKRLAFMSYANITADHALKEERYDGESLMIRSGDYYITTATNAMPYQIFELEAGENPLVSLQYTGRTRPQERLAMFAYNYYTFEWNKLASAMTMSGDVSLDFELQAARYIMDGRIRVMIAPEIAANGSDTFMWISDTQYYTERYAFLDIYRKVMIWAREQYQTGGIAYVAHTGDVIQDLGSIEQLRVADTAQKELDYYAIPNGIASGNHDVKPDQYQYWEQWFGKARYEHAFWYGQYNNRHSYNLVTLGGRDFIFLYLGYETEITEGTVGWANAVLEQYRHRTAIICLHSYLEPDGSYTKQGDAIYKRVVTPNANVLMVLCGHYGSVTRNVKALTSPVSRRVFEVLANYQEIENGGNGYIRLAYFRDGLMQMYTYSPYLNDYMYFANEEDAFSYSVALPDTVREIYTRDFIASAAGA